VLKLAVSASSAVPAPLTAAHEATPAVVNSASRPGDLGFTYESGDGTSSWDTQV
jgi:hypothetical protein